MQRPSFLFGRSAIDMYLCSMKLFSRLNASMSTTCDVARSCSVKVVLCSLLHDSRGLSNIECLSSVPRAIVVTVEMALTDMSMTLSSCM
ncbi:hypothetical protein GOP47_0021056 [Adiantum capillus-veneris]|uniref:Uncharacterized protein n=1 Tax=Adiantum capillus-veneris TaxID=13818 RepID=A0A9D4UAD5_ADICA|nr:hypothetical protein GOP47_0021056 [Adiantum capillus-veneris]